MTGVVCLGFVIIWPVDFAVDRFILCCRCVVNIYVYIYKCLKDCMPVCFYDCEYKCKNVFAQEWFSEG